MLALGARIAGALNPGDTVLFFGNLGAGKTTLIRGILTALGWKRAVRSPTFNLFSVYETQPPVLHADLYRVSQPGSVGIEDYLDTHVCLVEWPEALAGLLDFERCIQIKIEFAGEGRIVELSNITV